MTELLRQAIAQIEKLPADRQDAIAARFLAELEGEQQADDICIEDVREKIDAAISASEQTPPIDGERFVNQILERFQRDSEALP
jgi:antitoxin ParD1/3/4